MDLKEIKKKKGDLEVDILDMLKKFEKDTGVFINYVNVRIDRYGEYDLPVAGANEKRKRKNPKGLYDVTIEVSLNKEEM